MNLILAAHDQIVFAERTRKGWQVARQALAGKTVTAVIAREGFVIAGTTDGLFRSGNGGENWQEAVTGLDTPWPNHMVERFTQVGEEVFAVLSNGEVFATRSDIIAWKPVLPELEGVNAVTTMVG